MEFVLTVFLFTAIGFVAVSMLGLFFQFQLAGPDYQLPKYLMIPLLLIEATPGFFIGLWFAKKQSNKQYWELTDTELKTGSSGQKVFKLDSIDKIVVGLPIGGLIGKVLKQDKHGSVTGKSLDILSAMDGNMSVVRKIYLPAKENSLVLCFSDGSWLPLCLYLLPNGAVIMNELKERFKDRLIHDYNYSKEEIKRLQSRDINELIHS